MYKYYRFPFKGTLYYVQILQTPLEGTLYYVQILQTPLKGTLYYVPSDISCFYDHGQKLPLSLLYYLEIRKKRGKSDESKAKTK